MLKIATDFRRFAMVTDLWLMQDGIAEGHSIVIDMEGLTLSHLAKVGLIALKKFMFYIQVDNTLKSWALQLRHRNGIYG